MTTTNIPSENALNDFAAGLAAGIRPGAVIGLSGTLGAGKTALARALIRALTGDPGLEVPSPTFTLVQTYDTRQGPLWHFDLYRLKNPDEIYELGWEDALSGPIVLIEWPERLGALKPRGMTDIRLEIPEGDALSRVITVGASS